MSSGPSGLSSGPHQGPIFSCAPFPRTGRRLRLARRPIQAWKMPRSLTGCAMRTTACPSRRAAPVPCAWSHIWFSGDYCCSCATLSRLTVPRLSLIVSYAIMRQCWEEEPEDRPLFPDLHQDLLVCCLQNDVSGAEAQKGDAVIIHPFVSFFRRSPGSSAKSPSCVRTAPRMQRWEAMIQPKIRERPAPPFPGTT